MRDSWHTRIAWGLAVTVSSLAVYVWGNSFDWQFSALNAYQFFPVLGLVAFSLMWSHYVVGFLKRIVWKNEDLQDFFRTTGYIVLIAILLHPGILVYQRFRDGYGLPPHSYETYVAPGMAWLTLLGSVSLLVFLTFELHRWCSKKAWWKYVLIAGDAAMLAVFYHGLRLGSQLQGGWFQVVWWFYGTTLVITIVYKYVSQFKSTTSTAADQ